MKLSIHDLTRRSTLRYSVHVSNQIFQFTTSRGGRLNKVAEWLKGEAFQFTTSRGGRHEFTSVVDRNVAFQFTTSRGGRRPLTI